MKTSRILSPVFVATVTAVTAVTAVLALTGPGFAATTTVTDRHGDAPSAIDLTRAKYVNRDDIVAARLRVRDLDWSGSFTLYLAAGDPEEATVALSITAHPGHRLRRSWAVMSRGGNRPLSCPGGVRADYRAHRDVVTFWLRRSCIPSIRHNPSVAMVAESVLQTATGRVVYDDIDEGFVSVG